MSIWDADFHRTNEERSRARQAAESGEVAGCGFTGVSRFAEDQERARRRFEEQQAIQRILCEIAADEVALRERINDSFAPSVAAIKRAFEDAAP